MTVTLDEALKTVGGYHAYHITIFILLGLSSFIPLTYQGMIVVFEGYEPPHHCKVPANQTLYDTIPYEITNGEVIWDKCRMYRNLSLDNVTEPCTNGWTYYDAGYKTIVTDWDLVCDKNYMVESNQVAYQVASLFAELTISYLVDRFGRKPIHVICTLSVAIFGTITAYSVNYVMMTVFRCITGWAVVGSCSSGVTLLLELFDSSKRAVAGIGIEGPWLIVFLPMPFFAWLLTNWRHLHLTSSVINVVWIIYIWLLPESVQWLVATGKYDKAEAVLQQTAKRNGIKLKAPVKIIRASTADSLIENEVDKSPENDVHLSTVSGLSHTLGGEPPRDVTLKDAVQLLSNPTLRKHTLISMALWFGNCVVYYVLTLVSPTLPGDRFMNFFYLGIVELPAYILSLLLVKRFGRRIPLCIFHLVVGIPLIAIVFLPTETESGVNLNILSIVLMIIAKFGITVTFAIMVLYTRELFPTTLRATSSGLGCVIGRIGNVAAPIAAYAAKTSMPWLPSVICAIVSVTVGFLTLLLPETNNKPLPQTIADVHRLYDKRSQEETKDTLKGLDVEFDQAASDI